MAGTDFPVAAFLLAAFLVVAFFAAVFLVVAFFAAAFLAVFLGAFTVAASRGSPDSSFPGAGAASSDSWAADSSAPCSAARWAGSSGVVAALLVARAPTFRVAFRAVLRTAGASSPWSAWL